MSGSSNESCTPFASASFLSIYIASNESINVSNLEMTWGQDSPWVNQRVTAALIIFIFFSLCSIWAFSKPACFIGLNLKVFLKEFRRASNSKSFGYFGIRWTKHSANLWFRQVKYNEWGELWRINFCKSLCSSLIPFVPSNPESLMNDLSIPFSVSSCIIV